MITNDDSLKHFGHGLKDDADELSGDDEGEGAEEREDDDYFKGAIVGSFSRGFESGVEEAKFG